MRLNYVKVSSVLIPVFKDLIVTLNQVDDGVDIGDGDFSVPVGVGSGTMGVTGIAAHDDDINDAVGIGDGDLSITIHVTRNHYCIRIKAHALVDDFAVLDDMT